MRLFELRAPKPGTAFALHHDHLALLHEADDARMYWGQYWLRDHAGAHLARAATGQLDAGFDVFFALLSRHARSGARVLEGGSGPGHLVAALVARGYRATGIEYVPQIVEFARREAPTLDIQLGDVEHLSFEDCSFDVYASLGVIEHFENGPQQAIREAFRILRPGGLAIFEVPYLNPLRRKHMLALRAHPTEAADHLTFHQYYYDSRELRLAFESSGLSVLEEVPNCWDSVLFREHAVIAAFWSSPLAIGRIRKPLRQLVQAMPAIGRRRYAHTMAFACRKPLI